MSSMDSSRDRTIRSAPTARCRCNAVGAFITLACVEMWMGSPGTRSCRIRQAPRSLTMAASAPQRRAVLPASAKPSNS